MSLSPAPLSLLIKAAPILTEEMYGDIQPAAWELLLSMDEHMAGAAGKEHCLRSGSYASNDHSFGTEKEAPSVLCQDVGSF